MLQRTSIKNRKERAGRKFKLYFQKESNRMCLIDNLTFYVAKGMKRTLETLPYPWKGKFVISY